jgi:hypothetical protein
MNLQEQISRMKSMMESMSVDSWGRLHDEDSKIHYPYQKISKFIDWFNEEYGDYSEKQGWAIFHSDTDLPKIKYNSDDKYGAFFQVQRIDDPDADEALFGKLKDDDQADELAKKLGLMLDEYGVVIGWDGESFLD